MFDTGTTDFTLKSLKKVYSNRSLFVLRELKELLTLPKGYLFYLARRVLRSLTGKHAISSLRSFENDLSKLQFRIGTVATIQLNSGEILTGVCDKPKGFAGDPDKNKRVIEKFERECIPFYGPVNTARLLREILTSGMPKIDERIISSFSKNNS